MYVIVPKIIKICLTSLVAQTVKCLSTMQETWVQSLGWEDLLEKEMATHSSILAWKIPWMVEPGRLPPMGSQRVGHNWALEHTNTCTTYIISLVPFTKDGNQNLGTRNAYCC